MIRHLIRGSVSAVAGAGFAVPNAVFPDSAFADGAFFGAAFFGATFGVGPPVVAAFSGRGLRGCRLPARRRGRPGACRRRWLAASRDLPGWCRSWARRRAAGVAVRFARPAPPQLGCDVAVAGECSPHRRC